MIGFISNLFGRAEPVLSEASHRDAGAIAALHSASFDAAGASRKSTACCSTAT